NFTVKEIQFIANKLFAYLILNKVLRLAASLSRNSSRSFHCYPNRSLRSFRNEIARLRCDPIFFKKNSLQIGDFIAQTLGERRCLCFVKRRPFWYHAKEIVPKELLVRRIDGRCF